MYFYNNALHEVVRLSRQPTASARTTNRRTFLQTINHKRALFSVWLTQLKGAMSYRPHIRKELQTQRTMATTKNRIVHVDARLLRDCGTTGLVRFCTTLIDKYFKAGKCLRDAMPISLIVNLSNEDSLAFKKALLEKQIVFNDGYEHLEFQPWYFNLPPIINLKSTRTGRVLDVVEKCSYCIRIINQTTFHAHAQSIDKRRTR